MEPDRRRDKGGHLVEETLDSDGGDEQDGNCGADDEDDEGRLRGRVGLYLET